MIDVIDHLAEIEPEGNQVTDPRAHRPPEAGQ